MEHYNYFLYLVGLSVLYAYEDISYNKSTNQSHSHTDENYDASHAVDRNTLTCTRTYNIGLNSSHKTVWVTVDIGGIFNIHSINIQFKNYEGYENRQRGRFAGFSLFVSKSGEIQGSTLCYKDGSQLPPLNFTATCSVYGRYVIYYNERLDIVTYPPGYELFEVSTEICEFIVQGCRSGVYGSKCDMPCPVNCAYSTCHIDLGTCYDCKPGWTGTLCKKECREGWYGMNCSQQCIGHCRDGTFCNHVTGYCDRGCNTGWMGFICEKQCDDGTYGYDCVKNCSGHCLNNTPCNKQSGHCDMGCDPGYTNGGCSRKCPYGQFGTDCRKTCSGHCFNNEPCHHVNGVCPSGCRDGYTGIYCNNSCQRGFYGSDCAQSCSPNCKVCRHTDGLCTCKAGWTGYNCTNECVQSFGENCEHPCNIDCKIQACNRFNGSCLFGCKTGKQCEQGMLESDTTKQSAISPTFWIAGFSLLLGTNFILIFAFIRLWVVYLKRTNNTHKALCCWRSNADHAVTSTEVPRYQEIDVPNQAPTSLRSTPNADRAETSTNLHRYQEIDVPNQAPTSLRSTPNADRAETSTNVHRYQEIDEPNQALTTPDINQTGTLIGVPVYQELHLPRSTPNTGQSVTPTNVHRYQELQIQSQSLTSLRPAPNADRAETLTVVPRYQGLHLPCEGHTYASISPT